MASRYLYYYRSDGATPPHDFKNQVPAAVVWKDAEACPTVTGSDKITLVIRSHGASSRALGGTIGGANAALFARARYDAVPTGPRARINRVVLLSCWGGLGVAAVTAAAAFPAGVTVWGPDAILSNAGETMGSGANEKFKIKDGVTKPDTNLTTARGWSTRAY